MWKYIYLSISLNKISIYSYLTFEIGSLRSARSFVQEAFRVVLQQADVSSQLMRIEVVVLRAVALFGAADHDGHESAKY